MKKIVITIIIIFIQPSIIFGQVKNINRSNQQWIQYYNQTKLAEHWVFLGDVGFRWREKLSSPSQYIARLGVGYNIYENIRVSAGIAHLGYFLSDNLNRIEFRPYQEFLNNQSFGKIDLTHRFRIEERYFRKVMDGKIGSNDNFNFRFRYSVSLSIPLFKLSNSHQDKDVSMSIGDEIFLNAGKEVVYNIFDQNRILLGLLIQLKRNLRVEFTYNSQFAAVNSPAKYNYTDIIWLKINHELDLTN
jgi:hypothetical protein